MYRPYLYRRKKEEQILEILKKGDFSQLSLTARNTNLNPFARIIAGQAAHLASDLQKIEKKSRLQQVMLVVALMVSNQDHFEQMAELHRLFPNHQMNDSIKELSQKLKANPSRPLPTQSKAKVKYNYQRLLSKATFERYMSIPGVPVFLVSTNWLQRLFTPDEVHPPEIDNEWLVTATDYPLAKQEYMHWNYAVRQSAQERGDFQIVPYQAWKYIHGLYGGLQVKRFVTEEEQNPTAEVWPDKVTLFITQDRCIINTMNLLVSKCETMKSFLKRVMCILKTYNIVPDVVAKTKSTFYKGGGLSQSQVKNKLHDDSKDHLSASFFSRIDDQNILVGDLGLSFSQDCLILNFGEKGRLFEGLKAVSVLQTHQSCLNCQTRHGLTPCKCGGVWFCSQACKTARPDHKKDCDSLLVDQKKVSAISSYFRCSQRVYSDPKILLPGKPVGLENLGNTCYMNAALQCLLRMNKVSEYFLANRHLEQLNVSNVLGSKGYLASAFGEFVKDYLAQSHRILAPEQLLTVLRTINHQFRGFNHQDSQEFLNYFLDQLHEDLNQVKKKPYVEDVQSDGRPDEVISQINWDIYHKRNKSYIADLFTGQYKSQITCPDCNRISITFDPFMSVTLQFPPPEKHIDIEGYYMTEIGEFQKVKTKAPSSMKTQQFYHRYFGCDAVGVSQKDKKIIEYWDPKASLFNNFSGSGVLFFFPATDLKIRLEVEFFNRQKQVNEHFSRITYTGQLQSKDDIVTSVLHILRKPLKKVLKGDLTDEELIALCQEKEVVKILSAINLKKQEIAFPYAQAGQVKVKVELNLDSLNILFAPKFNASSCAYQGKEKSLLRKTNGYISVEELLEAFRQPQQLNEDNTWFCRNCKDHKQALKQMQIFKLPDYLILHLKRFNLRGYRSRLYGEKVVTPLLLGQVQTINGEAFELVGVVNHFGTLLYGHYTSQVKRGKQWHIHDDSRHYPSPLNGDNAYYLFYQKIASQ